MKKIFINKKNIYYYKIHFAKRNYMFNNLGLNLKKKIFFLKNKHIIFLQNRNLLLLEKKESLLKSISFLNTLKNYKAYRNFLGYPSRGQRTHTNAKTKKKQKNKNF